MPILNLHAIFVSSENPHILLQFLYSNVLLQFFIDHLTVLLFSFSRKSPVRRRGKLLGFECLFERMVRAKLLGSVPHAHATSVLDARLESRNGGLSAQSGADKLGLARLPRTLPLNGALH